MVDKSQNDIDTLIKKDRELYNDKKMTKEIISNEIKTYIKDFKIGNKNKSELIDIILELKKDNNKYSDLD